MTSETLTEQKTLTDLVQVDVQPPTLRVNFEAMKQALTNEVARYGDVVVTAETISEARVKAKEINATRKLIDQVRKDRRKEAMAPIEQFDSEMKSLTGICDEARGKITSQIDDFDKRRLVVCEELLGLYLQGVWEEEGVRSEYCRAQFQDLILLGSLTDKDKLTAAAKKEIEARAYADLAIQNRVDTRLLELEARSYRAGLESPLTRDHVHQWLEADEATYEQHVTRLIDAELTRQEQAQKRMREKIEREQREKEAREQARAEREQRQANQPPAVPAATEAKAGPSHPAGDTEESASPEGEGVPPWEGEAVSESMKGWGQAQAQAATPNPEHQPKPGRDQVVLTCTFTTDVPPSVPDEQIERRIRQKLESAGITSLDSITINRYRNSA